MHLHLQLILQGVFRCWSRGGRAEIKWDAFKSSSNHVPEKLSRAKGCSQELHGESFWQMNTVQENHNLPVNRRVEAGNGEITLICLTWNTLLERVVIAIKYGDTACVKLWSLPVSPEKLPSLLCLKDYVWKFPVAWLYFTSPSADLNCAASFSSSVMFYTTATHCSRFFFIFFFLLWIIATSSEVSKSLPADFHIYEVGVHRV